MAELKRQYNVPLRKEFQKVPRYKRAKKAAKALREFIAKHMKSTDVKLGRHINMKIWEKGISNPPHHVKVEAIKNDEGRVTVELEGKKYEYIQLQEKEEKGKLQQMVEKVTGKKGAKEEQTSKEDTPKDDAKNKAKSVDSEKAKKTPKVDITDREIEVEGEKVNDTKESKEKTENVQEKSQAPEIKPDEKEKVPSQVTSKAATPAETT